MADIRPVLMVQNLLMPKPHSGFVKQVLRPCGSGMRLSSDPQPTLEPGGTLHMTAGGMRPGF